jgi:hypothetical protein
MEMPKSESRAFRQVRLGPRKWLRAAGVAIARFGEAGPPLPGKGGDQGASSGGCRPVSSKTSSL